MNRRELLAILPSLSSLPFIGKAVEKEQNRIIIHEPKPIEVVQSIPEDNFHWDRNKLKFLVSYNGNVIGTAGVNWCSESGDDGVIMDSVIEVRRMRPASTKVTVLFEDEAISRMVHRVRAYDKLNIHDY